MFRHHADDFVQRAVEPQRLPDDESWTGAEVRACCRLAALLDLPLIQAAQNVVPVAGQPIFSAYLADGTAVNLATPLVLGSGTTINSASQTLLQTMKAVRITLTVQGKIRDPEVHNSVQVTMTGMARLPNN